MLIDLLCFLLLGSSVLSWLRSRRSLSRCSRHRHRARSQSKLCICIATIKNVKQIHYMLWVAAFFLSFIEIAEQSVCLGSISKIYVLFPLWPCARSLVKGGPHTCRAICCVDPSGLRKQLEIFAYMFNKCKIITKDVTMTCLDSSTVTGSLQKCLDCERKRVHLGSNAAVLFFFFLPSVSFGVLAVSDLGCVHGALCDMFLQCLKVQFCWRSYDRVLHVQA